MANKRSIKASAMGPADFWNMGWPKSSREWRSWSTNNNCPRLSSVAEEHQVRLPGPRVEAVPDIWGPEGEGLALVDIGVGVSPATSQAPFGFASGQESEPGVVLGSIALGMDEAVDGLMGYEGAARFQGQATSHLLGGPASVQSPQDLVPQVGVAVQLGTAPATSSSLLLGIGGIIPFGFGYVTLRPRVIVDVERSILAAIWPRENPSLRIRAISHRSSMVRW